MKDVLIQQVPILASLPAGELDDLGKTLAVRRYPAGTILMREGEPGASLYVILSGRAESIKALGTADERPLGASGPGDFVGELSLLNPDGSRTASVRAATDVELLEIPGDRFDSLLRRYPSVGYEVVHVLSRRLSAANDAAIRDLHRDNQALGESNRRLDAAYRQLRSARRVVGALLVVLLIVASGVAVALGYFLLSARTALDSPSDLVLLMSQLGRSFIIPRDVAALANPVPATPDTIADARRIFTTRCALCHGNDGKGQTAIGSHTYPRAADLTAPLVQDRSDGELYWIVANGSPHTGMPGWKGTLSDDELWRAVTYMRLLPRGEGAITQLLPTPTPTVAPTPSAAPALTLTMENDYYIPEVITVPVGTKVTWLNKDPDVHTVTSESDPRVLSSGILEQDQSWSFTFTQLGTYRYFCEPHDFMHGVVVVQ